MVSILSNRLPILNNKLPTLSNRLFLLLCLNRATSISEEEARDALLAFVGEHCCYGKGAAEDMDIKDINPSSAYHVSTVEPPLSGGHPRGPGKWSLDGGWPLNRGLS